MFAFSHLKPLLEQKRVIVIAGSTNAYADKNSKFTIKTIFYHTKFDRASPVGFDVALVEINDKAEIRTKYEKGHPFINTVCLPIEGKEFTEGQAVKLAGWGDTESKDPNSKPEHLLTTDLILTNGEECANIFSKRLKKVKDQYHNYKDFICADYHGERDACQGKCTYNYDRCLTIHQLSVVLTHMLILQVTVVARCWSMPMGKRFVLVLSATVLVVLPRVSREYIPELPLSYLGSRT